MRTYYEAKGQLVVEFIWKIEKINYLHAKFNANINQLKKLIKYPNKQLLWMLEGTTYTHTKFLKNKGILFSYANDVRLASQ